MVAQTQVLLFDAEDCTGSRAQTCAKVEPAPDPAGLAEEFQLHLLELARAEREVAGRDLVAEGFADLRDARMGSLLARRAQNVVEVDEDALRRLGTEVNRSEEASSVTPWNVLNIRLNLRMVGEVVLAALRAGDLLMILDHLLELGVLQAVNGGDFANL